MFPYRYAREKMTTAVRLLAIGEGDVRSRLWPAFLEFHTLKPDDFPDELREDFKWIIRELTKRAPQFREWSEIDQDWVMEGIVPANLRRMRNRTGSRIAEKLYDLGWRLRAKHDEWIASQSSSRD